MPRVYCGGALADAGKQNTVPVPVLCGQSRNTGEWGVSRFQVGAEFVNTAGADGCAASGATQEWRGDHRKQTGWNFQGIIRCEYFEKNVAAKFVT